MSTTTFPIRVALFAALVAVGALNWGARTVSSQPEAQGAIESYFVAHSTSERNPPYSG